MNREKSLLVEIERLEAIIEDCEKAILIQRIEHLEDLIESIEVKIRPPNDDPLLAEKFIQKVLREYSNLIDSSCRSMARKLNSPYIDADDLKQEALVYLIKWCLPKVSILSKDGEMWVPYLKRSLYNSFVNIAKAQMTKSRKCISVELTDEIKETYPDSSSIQDTEIEYHQLLDDICSKLKKRDSRILRDILNPSKKLVAFISKRIKNQRVKSPRRILSEYYNVPLSTINSIFAKFKKVISKTMLEESNSFCSLR